MLDGGVLGVTEAHKKGEFNATPVSRRDGMKRELVAEHALEKGEFLVEVGLGGTHGETCLVTGGEEEGLYGFFYLGMVHF